MGIYLKHSPDFEQFGQLKARIEAMFPEPALIVITSATRGDGKTATALGLARVLADADCRVLYVDANVAAPTLDRSYVVPMSYNEFSDMSRLARSIPEQRFSALSFADKRLERAISLDKVKCVAAEMRRLYDFIIVDTAPLVTSEIAVLFSSISDGTLLTLRFGRLPVTADKETVEALSRVGANMIGALTLTRNFIKTFAAAHTEALKTALPAKRRSGLGKYESDKQREAADVVSPSAVS